MSSTDSPTSISTGDSASRSKPQSAPKITLEKPESNPAVAAGSNDTDAEVPDDGDDPSPEHDAEEKQGLLAGNRHLLTTVPSWLASMVIHAILLTVLALLTIPTNPKQFLHDLTLGNNSEEVQDLEQFVEEDIAPLDADTIDEFVPEMDLELDAEPDILPSDDLDSAQLQVEVSPLSEISAGPSGLLSNIGTVTGSGLEGRKAGSRAALVRAGGGNAASEAAVAEALRWLAAHQNDDGSWNLDHRFGPCQSRCGNPGARGDAPNGATALALLPFLGAGQTHREGDYKKTVERGLAFLMRNMKIVGNRGSLYDEGGRLYSHGLGAIVLCEAWAMTKDKRLHRPAQMTIYFTAYAQDPNGGGWRYEPHERGDTSAVGWQIMALKSAHMAYLDVPELTYKGAHRFLNSVQTEEGAKYGYLDPGKGSGTTAVGLLSRMYLGWKRDNPALERGVEFLSTKGPSSNNMYYNYYATQVLHHFGGEEWERWNSVMRDYLVGAQSKNGHEKGSWFFPRGGHSAEVGGRLYTTSMAAMILEVYYRHMPIYTQQAAEDDFPL